MPGRYNNYDFVVDSSFKPFSMQEMLVPLQLYKEEYDKIEAAYETLADKSDQFRYLSETLPEGSRARQLYEGYANELNKQAADLAQNGLNMGNRRALTNLKRRYQGEIGRLVTADTAMQEERKLRRQMNAKDSSMLYASDNLAIDDFLDGNTPNLYNISGTELYTRGAAAGKAASSRIYSAGDEGSTLNGYYRKWVERNGYSKESMDAFRANAVAIPELQQAADAILAERGVLDNLTGNNLERARQSVLNGIIDGAVYAESVKPVRDAGVMSASERAADSRARQSLQLQRDRFDYERKTSGITVNNDGTVTYDPTKDAAYQRMKKLSEEGGMNGYKFDPVTGKYVKGTEGTAEEKKETEKENKKDTALLALDKKALRDEKGFDVNVGNERQHYDYIAALVHNPKQDKWYSGHLGEDFKGHRGIALWSDINVVDYLGNYSVTRWKDRAERRVLAGNEIAALANNPDIANNIEDELVKSNLYTERTINSVMSEYNLPREKAVEQLEKNGYKYISDYQLVAVKNDEGEDDYLIAVRTK